MTLTLKVYELFRLAKFRIFLIKELMASRLSCSSKKIYNDCRDYCVNANKTEEKMATFIRLIILLISKTIQLIPQKIIIFLCKALSWVACRLLKFRYAIIKNHLEVAFGKSQSPEEIKSLINKVYLHLCLTMIEILQLPHANLPKLSQRVEIEGFDHIESALKQKKGVFILTGHIGSWELAGIAISNYGIKISAIGKEMKSQFGNMIIKLIRDDNGITTIPKKHSMKNILKSLKNNEAIVVMLDQNMTGKDGIFVDFFGHKANTMTALAVLADRTGTPIIPGYTFREKNCYHHKCVIEAQIKLENNSENSNQNIIKNTQILTHKLESYIKEHPDQWIWIHKRWRTRPIEETSTPFIYKRRHKT